MYLLLPYIGVLETPACCTGNPALLYRKPLECVLETPVHRTGNTKEHSGGLWIVWKEVPCRPEKEELCLAGDSGTGESAKVLGIPVQKVHESLRIRFLDVSSGSSGTETF